MASLGAVARYMVGVERAALPHRFSRTCGCIFASLVLHFGVNLRAQ